MTDSWLALTLPPLILVPFMGLLSRYEGGGRIGAELRRKALHVSLGVAALWFPVVLPERWMVLAGLGLILGWMIAVRKVPSLRRHFGRVLQAANRKSCGELWFAVAIALLMLVTGGSGYLYAVPLLIMTLADAAAAIVGKLYPAGQYSGLASGKTLTGSAAFMVCAFVISVAGLHLTTSLLHGPVIVIAACTALLTTATEAYSRHGTDNFSVPVVAWMTLQMLLPTQTGG